MNVTLFITGSLGNNFALQIHWEALALLCWALGTWRGINTQELAMWNVDQQEQSTLGKCHSLCWVGTLNPASRKRWESFRCSSVFLWPQGEQAVALDLADENASVVVMSSPPCSRGRGCIFSLNLNLIWSILGVGVEKTKAQVECICEGV